MLSIDQISQFNLTGFLVIDNVLETSVVTKLNDQFDYWKDESRGYDSAYGTTFDGRPRFDLEPGHSPHQPALRRVASPLEISQVYLDVMRDNLALNAIEQLIGPNIRFNNCKINSKQPGAATHVKYHQDFMFEPHSNDDLITVLFFLDDVTPENGALEVVPGTHRGELFPHWHNGVFTGAVSDDIAQKHKEHAVMCFGSAGSACLMHTRLLHGSAPNTSQTPRTLYICEYTAEDSYPLQQNHIPSKYMGDIVRGVATNRVRCSDYTMQFPEVPTGASFFDQQAKDLSP